MNLENQKRLAFKATKAEEINYIERSPVLEDLDLYRYTMLQRRLTLMKNNDKEKKKKEQEEKASKRVTANGSRRENVTREGISRYIIKITSNSTGKVTYTVASSKYKLQRRGFKTLKIATLWRDNFLKRMERPKETNEQTNEFKNYETPGKNK